MKLKMFTRTVTIMIISLVFMSGIILFWEKDTQATTYVESEDYRSFIFNQGGWYSFNCDIYMDWGAGKFIPAGKSNGGGVYRLDKDDKLYVKESDWRNMKYKTYTEGNGGLEESDEYDISRLMSTGVVTFDTNAYTDETVYYNPSEKSSTGSRSLGTTVGDSSQNKDDGLDSILTPLVRITQILLLIGAGVCVGKLLHIGILFVTSSAVERSNAKMAMLPWLIGTFVCFGASAIGSFVIKILSVHKDVLSY